MIKCIKNCVKSKMYSKIIKVEQKLNWNRTQTMLISFPTTQRLFE